jgi:hypothetical protein
MGTGKGRMLGAHGWDIRVTDITKTFLQVSKKQIQKVKRSYADTDAEVSLVYQSLRSGCPIRQALAVLSLSPALQDQTSNTLADIWRHGRLRYRLHSECNHQLHMVRATTRTAANTRKLAGNGNTFWTEVIPLGHLPGRVWYAI